MHKKEWFVINRIGGIIVVKHILHDRRWEKGSSTSRCALCQRVWRSYCNLWYDLKLCLGLLDIDLISWIYYCLSQANGRCSHFFRILDYSTYVKSSVDMIFSLCGPQVSVSNHMSSTWCGAWNPARVCLTLVHGLTQNFVSQIARKHVSEKWIRGEILLVVYEFT